MVLDDKVLGNRHFLNNEQTCSKEEFLEAKKNGTVKDILDKKSTEYLQVVAFDIDESEEFYILEDSTGRLHLKRIHNDKRRKPSYISDYQELNFKELSDINFSVKVTEPLDLFDSHPRSVELRRAFLKKMEDKKGEK